MPILGAKTNVAGGATSAWVDTDGSLSIIVGVEGKNFTVEYNLGSDIVYAAGPDGQISSKAVSVSRANEVRVVNRGSDDLDFEVFG